MITCNLKGGLGNQMFQIAATQALVWDNDDTCYFKNSNTPNQGEGTKNYIDNVFSKIVFRDEPFSSVSTYKESDFRYNKIPYTKGMILDGYFQSPHYFDLWHGWKIRDLFRNEDIIERLKKEYEEILSRSVSVHIRRGDYIDNPVCKLLPMKYYYKALKGFENWKNILVFSDDIEWCKKNFKETRITYIEGLKDYEDMYLMSLCKNNIISNSSFSWWGAYLNKRPMKLSVAPEQWFSSLDCEDIYTPGMIKI